MSRLLFIIALCWLARAHAFALSVARREQAVNTPKWGKPVNKPAYGIERVSPLNKSSLSHNSGGRSHIHFGTSPHFAAKTSSEEIFGAQQYGKLQLTKHGQASDSHVHRG